MNIIYASCTSSSKKFYELFNESKKIPGQQVQKYHRLIMEGMVINGSKVKTITALPITKNNYDNKILKKTIDEENGILYTYLPIINLPILKNILLIISSFIITLRYLNDDKKSVLVCDVLNISVSIGALFAAKLLKRKNIGIVTDIPIFLSEDTDSYVVKFNNYIINRFDSYVFLTEQMNTFLNTKNAPHVVIEGQVDWHMKDIENKIEEKNNPRIVIYAGGLQKIYGIKYLTEAFIKSNLIEVELHIYGSGDFEDELIEICKNNDNIKYFGVVPNQEVVEAEIKATLLVNPRPSTEEYTKFSFPSKNMEYMASGTPLLTTNLPGMPKEYKDFVYLIEDETIEGLIKSFKEIFGESEDELYTKGKNAKEFVLKEKNNIVQTKKIIDMIESY